MDKLEAIKKLYEEYMRRKESPKGIEIEVPPEVIRKKKRRGHD